MDRLTHTNKGMAWYKSDLLLLEPCELSYSQVGQVLRRLGAYEDTGLTPEEIKEQAALIDTVVKEVPTIHRNLSEIVQGESYDRLCQLAQADKAGRVAILPCPLGSTVYVIGWKYRHGKTEGYMNTGSFRFSDMEKLGVTVFLTRKKAEEAMAKPEKALAQVYP